MYHLYEKKMGTLNDFDLPNDHEVALCEINGKVHTMIAEYANLGAFTHSVDHHPKIHITRDQLHASSSGDEGRALFLPVSVSFLKQLTKTYYEQGPYETLQLASAHRSLIISKPATLISAIIKSIRKVRSILNPNSRYSYSVLISTLGQTRDWQNSTIRFLSWHPYCTKLAVVTCDDVVRIYSSGSSYSPVLRSKQQRNISCVAWRPMSNTEIAVAHEDGIIVWNIDPNSVVSKPSVSNATILHRSDHKPVISIAWSPKGDKLISVAACDNTVYVWDPELDRTSSLKRPGGSGQVLVKWSPSGEKIFTCSDGIVFRVWDHRNWECERWTVSSGRVQSACWSNCGTHLLFTPNNEPVIYGVVVKNDLVFASSNDASPAEALPVFDVSKTDLDGVLIGGLVQCMEGDPKGKHLAVMFQETNVVAVFGVSKHPNLRLTPGSLISGLSEERPSHISFQQNFEEGACLTIGWSSGRVQYYPIVYTDLAQSL